MKMPKRLLVTLLFTIVLESIAFGLIVPFLPNVARELGASEFVATLLGTTFAVAVFLSSRIWGQLSDRYGRRPTILAAVVLEAAGFVSLWLAGSFAMLFFARALSGIASGSANAVTAYVADVTTEEERAHGIGLMMAAGAVGLVFGPVMGGLIEAHSPLEREGALSAMVCVALAVINFGLLVAYVPESLPAEKRSRKPLNLSPLHREGLKETLALPGLPLLMVMTCGRMLALQGLIQTYRMFTGDEFGVGPDHTGYVLGMFGVILIIMQGLSIKPLLRLAPEKRLLHVSLAVEVCGYLLIPLSTVLPYGTLGLYVANAVIAFGAGVTDPCLSAICSKAAPPESMGVTLGTLGASRAFGSIVGPMIAGSLYQEVSHSMPYFVSSAILAIMVVLTFRLPTAARTGATPEARTNEAESLNRTAV